MPEPERGPKIAAAFADLFRKDFARLIRDVPLDDAQRQAVEAVRDDVLLRWARKYQPDFQVGPADGAAPDNPEQGDSTGSRPGPATRPAASM